MMSLNVAHMGRRQQILNQEIRVLPFPKNDSIILKTTKRLHQRYYFNQFYQNIYQLKLSFMLLQGHLLIYILNLFEGIYLIHHLE